MRPRILLIKPVLPYPPDSGTKIVSFRLIRTLQDVADVTVLTRLQTQEEAAPAEALDFFRDRFSRVYLHDKHQDDMKKLKGYRRNSSLVESFMTGLLVTFLGTPCTAPMLGPALGYAFSKDSVTILGLWPLGVPSGTTAYVQWFFKDTDAPTAEGGTSALRFVTP